MRRLDKDQYPEYPQGTIMSNYDHSIDADIKKILSTQRAHSGYPGWNFHARVWYEGNEWNAEVWQYGSYIETVSADELEDLKSAICEKYGSD